MKEDFLLRDFIEAEGPASHRAQEPPLKRQKASSFASKDAEMQVASFYNEVYDMLDQNHLDFELPERSGSLSQSLSNIKELISYLLTQPRAAAPKSQAQQDAEQLIPCENCRVYEASLQKLQNDIRQHIRLEQQLKNYQDSLEDKNQEFKKEVNTAQKELSATQKELTSVQRSADTHKRAVDELKQSVSDKNACIQKLESELQKIKQPFKSALNPHPISLNQNQSKRSTQRLPEGKENKIDWMHHHLSTKPESRRSAEKRLDSVERSRISQSKPIKGITLNDKYLAQRNKEERKKAMQNKFEYRK